MAANVKRVVCRNFGCGQEYDEEVNDGLTNPCLHHSGQPFFHDAYKGWTCCQQKSTDFTTFLNFKGCQTGRHSTVAPQLPAPSRAAEPPKAPKTADIAFRCGHFRDLELKESANASTATDTDDPKPAVVCKRCRKSDVKDSQCVYHCGQTIFHDSLKYWTCCPRKKFTEFEEFEALRGCRTADMHDMEALRPKTRVDWFQTPESVHLVLYGLKGARVGNGSRVDSDGQTLRAVLCDKHKNPLFAEEWLLKKLVDSEKSCVTIDRNKVEIRLRKAVTNDLWPELEDR